MRAGLQEEERKVNKNERESIRRSQKLLNIFQLIQCSALQSLIYSLFNKPLWPEAVGSRHNTHESSGPCSQEAHRRSWMDEYGDGSFRVTGL